jgi:hypothetical protein
MTLPIKCSECESFASAGEAIFFMFAGDLTKPDNDKKFVCKKCMDAQKTVNEFTKQAERATSWSEEMDYLDARENVEPTEKE